MLDDMKETYQYSYSRFIITIPPISRQDLSSLSLCL